MRGDAGGNAFVSDMLPAHCVDFVRKFLDIKRLHEVMERVKAQTFDGVFGVEVSGEQDDRCAGRHVTERHEYLYP
jgi:hypothetical protein